MSNTIRTLATIAREIDASWANVNYAARPYLDAMLQLDTIEDNYYSDSARSIVAYFLANAGSFRGDAARRIKAELRSL